MQNSIRHAAAMLLALTPLSAGAQSAGPTDAQIAHIAYTAGAIDIEAANQALQRSKNTEVLAFAKDMVRDHEAVNKQALALVEKLQVTPEDNDTSRGLAAQAAKMRTQLGALEGEAFDSAYAANEVAYHQSVNGALKSVLIPSADNADLKALLSTGLKLFEGHQAHAEHLVAELM